MEDAVTGLTYMQARYFDPVIGRFYSTDPIDYQDQLNLYAYVRNDPVNLVDPDGEVAWFVGAVLGAGLEIGIQAVEISLGMRDDFDQRSIGISALAGAAGVGIISKANRIGVLGKLAVDAAASAGASLAKGEEVTLADVAADVSLGEIAGAGGKKIGDGIAAEVRAEAAEHGRRAQKFGFKRDSVARDTLNDVADGISDGAARTAGVLGANAGGDTLNIATCIANAENCEQ